MDAQACAPPLRLVIRKVVAVGDADAAINRDPAHQLAVHILLTFAADFPDRRVRLLPALDRQLDDVAERLPQRGEDGAFAVASKHIRAVEHLAVHIELELVDGGVTNANRSRSAIPLEVLEGVL